MRSIPIRPGFALTLTLLIDLACGGSTASGPKLRDRVFVAGYASTGTLVGNGIPNQALLWEDGQAVPLSPGSPSFASALTLQNEVPVILGAVREPDGQRRAMVWRNGHPTSLPSGAFDEATPSAISATAGQVAAGGALRAGSGGYQACLWLHGNLTLLSPGTGSVLGLVFEGDQPVAAGYAMEQVEVEPNRFWNRPVPQMWRGGQAIGLGAPRSGGEVRALLLAAGEIHAVGYEFTLDPAAPQNSGTLAPAGLREGPRTHHLPAEPVSPSKLAGTAMAHVAMHWRDGVPTRLSDGLTPAMATAVCVSGSDVFVAGARLADTGYDAAVYWKNGTRVDLTHGASQAMALGIAVAGSDVYICGYEMLNGVSVATIWKNGEPQRLTDGTLASFALGIVVQQAH